MMQLKIYNGYCFCIKSAVITLDNWSSKYDGYKSNWKCTFGLNEHDNDYIETNDLSGELGNEIKIWKKMHA